MRKGAKPIHIICNKRDIAENVIIAGDPKRTEYYAKKFLKKYKLVSNIRSACVYTGYYKGKRFTLLQSLYTLKYTINISKTYQKKNKKLNRTIIIIILKDFFISLSIYIILSISSIERIHIKMKKMKEF